MKPAKTKVFDKRKLLTHWAPLGLVVGGTVAFAQNGALPKASLSVGETMSQSRQYMGDMNGVVTRVEGLQASAKKLKDVLKLGCVTDKLVRTRGHVAVASQTMSAIEGAVAKSDEGARQHEFTRLTILWQKVTVLHTEAEGCVGEEATHVSKDTKVDVEVDPNIPDEDPTEPKIPDPDVTRSPAASPYV